MADDEAKIGRTRFLSISRSKWSRSSKEKEVKTEESLDNDVADFLKPSTDRAALLRPRIDVAIAQRWPEAQSVTNPDALPSFHTPQAVNNTRKKRRKDGLVVSFASTAPEIIGEGGDESEYATIEVSKAKARRPGIHQQRRSVDCSVKPAHNDAQVLKPLRRANTSHNDSSERLEPRQYGVAPAAALLPERREPYANSPLSYHDRKRSLMVVNEGMALKRASILDLDDSDNDEHDDDHDPPPHFGPLDTNSHQATLIARAGSPTKPPMTAPQGDHTETIAEATLFSPNEGSLHTTRHVNMVNTKQPASGNAPQMPNPVVIPQSYPGQAQYSSPQLSSAASDSSREVQSAATTNTSSDRPRYIPYSDSSQANSQTSLRKTNMDKSPIDLLRRQNVSRSNSTGSTEMSSSSNHNSIEEKAWSDFNSRVAHMKGVLHLTAQRERPSDQCTPIAWLRTACWWYIQGKLGLEFALRQRAQSGDNRQLLLQGHVDLAKTWWILTSPLESSFARASQLFKNDCQELQTHLRALCLLLGRNNMMPPIASLIQGQDTRIWIDAQSGIKSDFLGQSTSETPPLAALPPGDNAEFFCYSRFQVDVVLSDAKGTMDRNSLPCLLSVIRYSNAYQTAVVIADQAGAISLKIGARRSALSQDWRQVTWSQSMSALSVHLPDGTALHARLQGSDYRSLGNMFEYTRKVGHLVEPEVGESLVFKAPLSSLQYATVGGPSAFPRDKVSHSQVQLFKRRDSGPNSNRVVLLTEPSIKVLSYASHRCISDGKLSTSLSEDSRVVSLSFDDGSKRTHATLAFEEAKDAARFFSLTQTSQHTPDSRDATAMSKQSLRSMTDAAQEDPLSVSKSKRQHLFCNVSLTTYNITAADRQSLEDNPGPLPFRWESLIVSKDLEGQEGIVGHTEHLRIMATHSHGAITDSQALEKGELYFRIISDLDNHTIKVICNAKPDIEASLDTGQCPPDAAMTMARILQLARSQPTIRSYTFRELTDLHTFQAAVSKFSVRYDGQASAFAISRRRMVVPIHHKWIANQVRLQVVANDQGNVIKILAFMDAFEHADALCFQAKSTDVFEKIKGDSKGKKWSIKLVDAKFSLPKKHADGDALPQSQFVNLDGLDYAEEHDDITISFDTEEHRDLFAQALPAATTVARMITLRRRI